jgi:hypothetical protein
MLSLSQPTLRRMQCHATPCSDLTLPRVRCVLLATVPFGPTLHGFTDEHAGTP